MPDQSKLQALSTEVEQFLYEQQELSVASMQDYQSAGEVIKTVKDRIKQLEAKRITYTKPLDEVKAQLMADFKKIAKPLVEFVESTEAKMLTWYKEEQKRKAEEQAKIDAAALEQAKQAGVSEIVVPVVEQPKTVKTDYATVTVKKTWKAEVVNEAEVPREYLVVDQVKINAAVRAGTREIPGVKIYQAESLATR